MNKILYFGCVASLSVQLASASDIAVDGCADVRILQDVVTVTSTGAVSFVRLKMGESLAPEMKVLNDAWERSYGDLEWQTLGEKTIYSPWYFLAEKDGKVQGFGVETGPGAMCCWEISAKGVTLVLDVRAGGGPVRLNGRTLKACRIVRAESKADESPWQFGRRFCRMMCPKPKLPNAPVYGYNDWYCAYGKNTATNFLADAEYIVSCAKGCANPPYVVMDDGWQKNSPPVVGESGRGPWDAAGANFGMEMPEFCRRIAALGAKPGLWYRPLRAWDELPEEQRLIADRNYLDPTVPAVRSRIVEDIQRFRDWGFKLVKIDFLSHDLSQIWPCDPLSYYDRYIQDDRKWRNDSRTTAEVMLDIYKAMKDAAGDDVVIIGCNAFNHLAAGVFELQRTGDDTSGKDWKRTRKNGINTLAMRSIQDGAFFKIDADCVGLASEGSVSWNLNRQWMELLGRSGTPFFVSWKRQLATPEVREALSKAFRHASSVRDVAEPLDWFESRRPRRWRFADGAADFQWSNDFAARPIPRPALVARLAEGPEIIGIVHWGLNTYTDREWGYGDEDPAMLNPAKFDADQIVGACKAGGIGGLVVVAKHHDGFCLWPTKTTEHNITKTPFWKSWSPKLELENEKIPLSNSNSKLELKRETGRDYIKEMEQACRRAGIKFGVYCSPWDRNNAHYGTEKYVTDVFQQQLRELLSGYYGEIFEMWFDGANGGDGYYGGAREKRKIPDGYYRYDTETFAMVRKLQPKVCIFNEMDEADFRFCGNEQGLVDPDSRSTGGHYDGIWANYSKWANTGIIGGTTFHPIESDFPLRKGWFYHESERGTTRSAAYLTKLYLSSVGNASTMNIGIAPNKDGLLDADDVKALAGFKTLKDALFAHEAKSGEPFNVVVMREVISKGEQVDEWEFVADGKAILRGKSIGLKRIRLLETPCAAKSCEVKVLKDGGALQGVSFKLYRADPELVRLVLSSTTESGETDTAKWMTAASDI